MPDLSLDSAETYARLFSDIEIEILAIDDALYAHRQMVSEHTVHAGHVAYLQTILDGLKNIPV
jgi:hypothetical protein